MTETNNTNRTDREITAKQKKSDSFWSEVLSYIKIFVLAIVIAYLCNTFVIVNAEVPTGSMKNTITEDDRLIGFRLSYINSDPQFGDIVIFKYPDDETQNYVKRVIGTPGDIVEIKKETDETVHVYVNGTMLDEPYIREPMTATADYERYIVPDDCYFMMGDNRNNSQDSRFWNNTFVKRDKILAKAIFKYYKGFAWI